MTYRIKITTYASGRKEYTPQVMVKFLKFFRMWTHLNYSGELVECAYVTSLRKNALEAIDLHSAGNNVVKSIEFEYVNK